MAEHQKDGRAELTVYRPGQAEGMAYRGTVTSMTFGRVSFVGGRYDFDGKWPEAKLALNFPSDWCAIEWLNEQGLSLGDAKRTA